MKLLVRRLFPYAGKIAFRGGSYKGGEAQDMNYRHAFHAGNFADLLKHAVLLGLLAALRGRGRPLRVIDTHAGAGVYDLEDTPTLKSGEAAAGILRLAGTDEACDPQLQILMAEVRAINPVGLRHYPGSPLLAARALGPKDGLIACELRDEEADLLRATLDRHGPRPGPVVRVRTVDGFGYVATVSPDPAASTLVLIDPPYEAGDDYDRVVETVERVLARMPDAVVAIWAPIKDLETLDFLLRRLEAIPDARGYVAQLRLRPLVNPMRMNGCAMIVLGAAETAAAALATTAQLVRLCGETGAQAVVHPLGG